jgi:hypothetical protein
MGIPGSIEKKAHPIRGKRYCKSLKYPVNSSIILLSNRHKMPIELVQEVNPIGCGEPRTASILTDPKRYRLRIGFGNDLDFMNAGEDYMRAHPLLHSVVHTHQWDSRHRGPLDYGRL